MLMWLERASKFIVWVIGAAIILDIFGIQIGPLVAGLGLFSVAVALGAQDFFKNLISGILIMYVSTNRTINGGQPSVLLPDPKNESITLERYGLIAES